MIWFLLVAAAVPGIFWDQGPDTAASLKQAGIECVTVEPAKLDAWKRAGFCAAPADLASSVQLYQPGVEFRPDVATATRAPWVTSNGWRLLRAAGQPAYYSSCKGKADLCAAEAFAYDAQALIRVEPADLERFGAMHRFLQHMDSPPLPPRANIGFIDDGSAEAGEIMNLMIRRNLLFRIVAAPDPSLDVNIQPGSAAANPNEFVAGIRRKLTDENRLLRIYGSEVVIGRLTGEGSHARLHLLNYGGRKIEGIRVRVLGIYKDVKVSTPAGPAPAADLVTADGATEFSLPALEVYAIVDLH